MSRRGRKEQAKQAILGELELLAQDRHPRNQTLMARFVKCGDCQTANRLLHEALGTIGRRQKGAPLSPPAGWLPPLT